MHRALPLRPVQGPPEGFPLDGDDGLAQVGEGIPSAHQGLLEARRVENGKNASKRLVGRNPLGPV